MMKITIKRQDLEEINPGFLSECKNESILSEFFGRSELSFHLLSNPHPMLENILVTKVVPRIDHMDNLQILKLASNTNDRVLAAILEREPNFTRTRGCQLLYSISGNRNPKAIEYMIEHHKRSSYASHIGLIESDWMYTTYNWLRMFSNAEDPLHIAFIFGLFKTSALVHHLPFNDNPVAQELIYGAYTSGLVSADWLSNRYGMSKQPELLCVILDHIKGRNRLPHALMFNDSDLVVDYILEHPEVIDPIPFMMNPNDKAVKYWLERPEKIDWLRFCTNTNPMAVEASKQWVKNAVGPFFDNTVPDVALELVRDGECDARLIGSLSRRTDIDFTFV